MPSPFHQKYSSQTHKVFGDMTTAMPEGPKSDAERRSSDSSITSASGSPTTERRRSSVTRFANLEALKRKTDEESMNRRASLHDAYGKPGVLGTMWNNFTRGPTVQQPKMPQQPKEQRDTTTLSQ
ncbi:hypothetical protein K458DRAFT_416186 [Lentithecium fluviatile CBS 122367]|uniref:Conidiation-specific expression protein n=1 Tax=Lentithecium fluviatile CBS 122367 TaxID=1168545 RepID=A0A6G1J9E9_9PLEO|nr:hypothetical protein K458DRAFT_416186 [Lentithecium fluviatile CBS 122367]